jgi:actin-related protein 4
MDAQRSSLLFAQGNHFRDLKSQEKLLELCLETLDVPSIFSVSNGILDSLSAGRPTSLVVDFSGRGTTITPVIGGYELKKSTIFTPVGGNMIDEKIAEFLLSSSHLPINPLAALLGKKATSLPVLSLQQYNPLSSSSSSLSSFSTLSLPSPAYPAHLRKSFLDCHYFDLIKDIKQWMAFIPHYRLASEFRSDEGIVRAGVSMPPFYELPDGTQVPSSYRLSVIPESLFFPEKHFSMNSSSSTSSVVLGGGVGGGGVGTTTIGSRSTANPGDSSTSSALADSLLGKRARELIENDRRENRPGSGSSSSFSSSSSSLQEESISDLIYLAISRCDVDVRRELLGNVLVTGGSSLLGGLTQRLTRELTDIAPSHLKVS